VLSPDPLAAQLRHPHGEHALDVACLAFGDAAFMRTLPFTAHGFHLHELAEVEQALRSAGLTVQGWRAHHETGRSNDGREVSKHFHLLLARR